MIGSHRRWAVLIVALLTAAGAYIRLQVAQQPLFADELSTYWIVKDRAFVDLLSTIYSHAEISPPAFFVASWITTHLGDTPAFVRLPSLLAGIATIPLVYLLGLRLANRLTALVAAAFTTCSPFMIYYSAEARGYALLMCLVVVSTLTMLVAAQTRRTRWWAAYAIATCAAVYTHYTSVFVFGTQLCWLLWAFPEARRPALWATLASLAGFLPWVPGLAQDFQSWTLPVLYELVPFTLTSVLSSLEHWALGFPYAIDRGAIDLPGPWALGLLAAAVLLSLSDRWGRVRRRGQPSDQSRLSSRLVLMVLLALAVPVGAAVAGAVGVHVFSVRYLAASWPGLAILLAARICGGESRRRYIAASLAVTGVAIGGAQMLTARYARPDFFRAADFVDRLARPGDVVVDSTAALSPGPLVAMDLAYRRPHRVFRAGAPQQRERPFGAEDVRTTTEEAIRAALIAAEGARVFMVSHGPSPDTLASEAGQPAYRRIDTATYVGFLPVHVSVYAPQVP